MSWQADFAFLDGDSVAAARKLLGCELIYNQGNRVACVRIVETEAYHQTDAASHSYKGQTPRTDVMFGPSGFLYVYFTYGMHYCMNVVTGLEGEGSAVLIRAIEPLRGEALLQENRPTVNGYNLTNGPAKLCQAMHITKNMNGHNLQNEPLQLVRGTEVPKSNIIQTTRIGISQAKDEPWRFYIKDNPYISKH